MDAAQELKKEGLVEALHPSILTVCDALSKYSCWLMTLLMTIALLLWVMKSLIKDMDDKEATVIYSSSTTAVPESEDGSEDDCGRISTRVRIPVRDNNAFRIRQMYAAMKMGKTTAAQQTSSSSKKK